MVVKKELKVFQIKAKDSKLFFWVYIYPDLKSLECAANGYNKAFGLKENHEGIGGVVHAYERIGISEDPEIQEKMLPNIGTIRLSAPNLTTEIVAHELIHAALWLYRKHYKRQAHFGVGCNEREEDFAYLHGQLFRDMTKKLYKHKFWGEERLTKQKKRSNV